MNVISLLIKPASGNCNLACDYCFYHDSAKHDRRPHHPLMNPNTMTHLLKEAYKNAKKALIVSFQGGEPLLAGIDFYEQVMATIKKEATVPTYLSIQTNGTLLTEEFVSLLKKHQFLVGISLDGPAEFHNRHRDPSHGSYDEVMKGINLLKEYEVPFNVLCVVTPTNVNHATTLYHFFKDQGLAYSQYIPGVPIYGDDKFIISATDYFHFLDELFTCWQEEILTESPVSIRLFDNMIASLLKLPTNACDLNEQCGHHLIVEANGDCYPCDFYVSKQYLLGNIHNVALIDLINSSHMEEFHEQSLRTSVACIACPYHELCWGGCQKYRQTNNHYLYCETMKRFFDKHIHRLNQIATMIHQ